MSSIWYEFCFQTYYCSNVNTHHVIVFLMNGNKIENNRSPVSLHYFWFNTMQSWASYQSLCLKFQETGAWKKDNAEIAGLSFLMHKSIPTRNVSAQMDWQLRQLLLLNCDLIVRQYYYVNGNVTKIMSILVFSEGFDIKQCLFFWHIRSSLLTFFFSFALSVERTECGRSTRRVILFIFKIKYGNTLLSVRHPVWFCLLKTAESCKSCTSHCMCMWNFKTLL